MAEMTIQLRCDPDSGKKDIVVSLTSDSDSLPHEHEQLHRQLVDRLIEGGVIAASEVGKLIVERAEERQIEEPSATSNDAGEAQSEGA